MNNMNNNIMNSLKFYKLNYKNGFRIVNHDDQIIIKDNNSIERFIQIKSFNVKRTDIEANDIIDSSYTYSGSFKIRLF